MGAGKAAGKPRELTREAIIETATRLLRQGGVDALSMRQIAAELNVTATALYYHFGGKDELLDELFHRVLKSVEPHDATAPWTVALEDLLVRIQYLASEYPGMQRHMANRLGSPAVLLWLEMILSVLKQGGFDDEQAATVTTIVGFYNSPVTLRGQRSEAGPWEPVRPEVYALQLQDSPELYPSLASALPHIRPPDEALFRMGLRTLIEGLAARLRHEGKKNPAA